jgi:ATP-binding cassette subfamily B protein RaxB
MTMRELRDVAGTLGMSGRAIRCEPGELVLLQLPAILHWHANHYVVLEKASKNHITINDPAVGRMKISMAEVERKFTGAALELSRAANFVKRKEASPLSIFSWFQWTPHLRSPLAQLLLLTIVLQIYVIASPFYLQTAVDQAVHKGDSDLLIVLAFGFGAACVFNAVATLLRDIVLGRLRTLLSWEMSVSLIRHLLRLPLQWFERRRLADIVSRMEAIAPIRDLVSSGIAAVIIDGLVVLATGAMMFCVAPKLALVAVIGLSMFVALRLLVMPFSLRLGGEAFTARIAEQGRRIEAVRAIQSVQAAGAEASCGARWENSYVKSLVADQCSSTVQCTFNSLHVLCDGLDWKSDV